MKLQFDIAHFAGIYQTFGRETVVRMLTVPGAILNNPNMTKYFSYAKALIPIFGREKAKRILFTIPGAALVAQAKRNQDDPAEIIAKRDIAAEALMDLVEAIDTPAVLDVRDDAAEALADLIEEYANLDDD